MVNPSSPFTWASGLKSPIYCDNRMTLSYPQIRGDIVDGFCKLAADMQPFDVVAGVATAGIPHGALLADRLQLPFIYVRSKPKGHGRRNQIEGRCKPGQRVLVVEDLLSTGKSSLSAIDALMAEQLQIAGLIAIFTYELRVAQQAFSQVKYPVKTLTNFESLLSVAVAEGLVKEADLASLADWRNDPLSWSDQQKK